MSDRFATIVPLWQVKLAIEHMSTKTMAARLAIFLGKGENSLRARVVRVRVNEVIEIMSCRYKGDVFRITPG